MADGVGGAARGREAADPRLHVNNLPAEVSEAEVRDVLEEVGPVKSLRLITGEGSNLAAICEYYDMPTAQSARRNLDGALIQEQSITVRFLVEVSSTMPELATQEEGKENGAPKAVPESAEGLMSSLPGFPTTGPQDDATLADVVNNMNQSQLLEVMWQVKEAVHLDPKVVRESLVDKPSFLRALFDAQLNLGMVNVPDEGGSEVTGPIMQQLLRMLKPLKAEPKAADAHPRGKHGPSGGRPPGPSRAQRAPFPKTETPAPTPPRGQLPSAPQRQHMRKAQSHRGARTAAPPQPPRRDRLTFAPPPTQPPSAIHTEPRTKEPRLVSPPDDLLKDPRLESLLHDTLNDPRLGSLLQELPDIGRSGPYPLPVQPSGLPLSAQQQQRPPPPAGIVPLSQPPPNMLLPAHGRLVGAPTRPSGPQQLGGSQPSPLQGKGHQTGGNVLLAPPMLQSSQPQASAMQMEGQAIGGQRPRQVGPGVVVVSQLPQGGVQMGQQPSRSPVVHVGGNPGELIVQSPWQVQHPQHAGVGMPGVSFQNVVPQQQVRLDGLPQPGGIVIGGGPSGPSVLNAPRPRGNFGGDTASRAQSGQVMPWNQYMGQGGNMITQVVPGPSAVHVQIPGRGGGGGRGGGPQPRGGKGGWRKRGENTSGGRWRGGGVSKRGRGERGGRAERGGRTGRGRVWRK
ncbi:unnamed protein product [Ostreobium quekettii]|uniref:RRM domain-containing protein n=1 Tax=Ostreobium quekettii TaxID=121088 RepID=A0A8S1J3V8_9CHLO|nr:unnamed protein product [Ostreobium quekettii]|eukprot:evm.model.scf_710.4 EVM.evm.TU.scf_710.4   scf_710:27292-33407(-)